MKYLPLSLSVLLIVFQMSFVQATNNHVTSILAPIGDSPQSFCEEPNLTLANMNVQNTSGYTEIYWFDNADQTGNQLPVTTLLEDGATYYAFQAIDPSAVALAVLVQVVPILPAPMGNAEQSFCLSDLATLSDAVVSNTTGYTDIVWFDEIPTCSSYNPIDPSTLLNDGAIYYATQGWNGCCPEYLTVTFTVITDIPAPEGDSPQQQMEGSDVTLADLAVFNTTGYSEIYWFDNADLTGSPLPSTTLLEDGTTYYATQGFGACVLFLEVAVELMPVAPAPQGSTEQYFCYEQEWVLNDIEVFKTGGYVNIYWFDGPDMATANQLNPSTTIIQHLVTYYATQAVGCCDGVLAVTVYIEPPTPAPIGDADQFMGGHTNYTLADAEVYNTTGLNTIYWFSTATQESGTDVPLTTEVQDNDVYYAFQAICNCTDCNHALPLEVTFHSEYAGVSEETNSLALLYPNPVSSYLFLNFVDEINSLKIELSDLNGRIVYKNNMDQVHDKFFIDVSKFESGVYILSLWADGKYQTNKILVE